MAQVPALPAEFKPQSHHEKKKKKTKKNPNVSSLVYNNK
jgi:hypothetical protein